MQTDLHHAGPKKRPGWAWPCLIMCWLCMQLWAAGEANGAADSASEWRAFAFSPRQTVIGTTHRHTIQAGETLLDIARQYDLGFNEIQDLCSGWDPWIPPVGAQVVIPTRWILPKPLAGGIVINIAELRLYYFSAHDSSVMTFPIAIGGPDATTPTGIYKITCKQVDPSWTVPPSLRDRQAARTVAPGPDNPLGRYWMGLGRTRYGIHGSDMPWSIGRLVTHGCIRLYPEDLAWLFKRVKVGTPVKIIYEPVKIGRLSDRIYVEVHADVYSKTGGLVSYGLSRLDQLKIARLVDLRKYYQALKRRNGLPADVTRSPT
jgi:L,D-transpeptidase ErfK/SrfK